MASLETAAHIYDAHVIAISETKQLPPKAKGYGKWNSKERKNRAGGGVAIAVRQDLVGRTSRVESLDEEDQEIVWIEIRKNNKEKLYIGTYYGKQENATVEDVEREFVQINTQISSLRKKGEIILAGDFNAKIDIKKEHMEQKQSSSGKHLQLIDLQNLQPILTKCSTGTWTWQNRNKPEEHSLIDYILTIEKVTDKVIDNIVDEERLYRIKGRKNSDHNTMLISINTQCCYKKNKILKRWKLNKKRGWK